MVNPIVNSGNASDHFFSLAYRTVSTVAYKLMHFDFTGYLLIRD